MAGPALVGIFWFAALFSPALCYPYHDTEHCFDGKMLLPVNIKVDSAGYNCVDKEGNEYPADATLISCCGCLKLTCENYVIIHTDPLRNNSPSWTSPASKWNLTMEDSCCMDCNGIVFPAGAIMNVTEVDNENCEKNISTTRCVYVDVITPIGEKGEAVAEVSFGFKGCCTDDTGIQKLGDVVLEKKICSKRTCERFEGNKYASWVSTLVFDKIGCDCCQVKFNGEEVLVEEGQECPGMPTSKCCEGECLVRPEDAVVA